MKISYNWLKEFVNVTVSPEELAKLADEDFDTARNAAGSLNQ